MRAAASWSMHDIFWRDIPHSRPQSTSNRRLTPGTDTDLLLATCRDGSHFTSDIRASLAHRHGLQAGLMALWRDTRTAGRIYVSRRLRQICLGQQSIGNYAAYPCKVRPKSCLRSPLPHSWTQVLCLLCQLLSSHRFAISTGANRSKSSCIPLSLEKIHKPLWV